MSQDDITSGGGQPTGGRPGAVADRAPDSEPASPAAGGQPTPVYAEWWRRAAALVIDLVVGCGVSFAFVVVLALAGVATDLPAGDVTGTSGVAVILGLLVVLAPMAYMVAMEGSARGATVGKMAVGIRVADATNLAPIGYARAFARRLVGALLWWLFFFPGVLDLLAPLWDPRHQTWHDKVVGSVVVDRAAEAAVTPGRRR